MTHTKHPPEPNLSFHTAGAWLVRTLFSVRGLRWLLAGFILALLCGTGRLDPQFLLTGPVHGEWLGLALALYLPMYLIGALRFHVVLHGMGAIAAFAQTWKVTMYAALGELALPSTFGGDAVKAVAAARAHDVGRLRGLAGAFVDRAIGLTGLILFAGLACCLGDDALRSDPRLARLPLLVLCCLATCAGSVLFLLTLRRWAPARLKEQLAAGRWTGRLVRLLGAVAVFCRSPGRLAFAVFLAAAGHFLWCLSALALSYGLELHPPLAPALIVLPLVILANTISFAGGIGGGVIAIELLFESLFGIPRGAGCKLGLAILLTGNLSRLIALPWLLRDGRKKGSKNSINSGTTASRYDRKAA
jgi:hypothetical protein